jgi:hypothetical protein
VRRDGCYDPPERVTRDAAEVGRLRGLLARILAADAAREAAERECASARHEARRYLSNDGERG